MYRLPAFVGQLCLLVLVDWLAIEAHVLRILLGRGGYKSQISKKKKISMIHGQPRLNIVVCVLVKLASLYFFF